MAKQTIDEIWAAMQAEADDCLPPPKARAISSSHLACLVNNIAPSPSSHRSPQRLTHYAIEPAEQVPQPDDVPMADRFPSPPTSSSSVSVPSSSCCFSSSSVSSSSLSSFSSTELALLEPDLPPQADDLPQAVQHAHGLLGSRVATVRARGLASLLEYIKTPPLEAMNRNADKESRPEQPRSSLLSRPDLFKPVLVRLTDSSERCRELALDILSGMLAGMASCGPLIPYIIPVVLTRVGHAEIDEHQQQPAAGRAGDVATRVVRGEEQSEELLERLASLLGTVAQKAGSCLGSVLGELAAMLDCLLRHHAPEVLLATCQACCELGRAAGHQLMLGVTPILLRTMLPCLANRRAAVRIAAIKALRVLLPLGGHEVIRDLTAFREHNVIPVKAFYEGETRVNRMAQLVKDTNPKVRLEFYRAMSDWLTNLAERYDYITLLLPYLISGLADDQPAVRALCLSVTEEMGRQYEQDHKEELKDRLYYGAKLEQAKGKPVLLVEPFAARPRLGARIIVSEQAARLLAPLLAEVASADWQTEPARLSLLAMRSLLVFWEDGVNTHARKLIGPLARALDNKLLSEPARACLQLLAVHANPDAILPAVADTSRPRAVLDIMARAYERGDNPYRAELAALGEQRAAC